MKSTKTQLKKIQLKEETLLKILSIKAQRRLKEPSNLKELKRTSSFVVPAKKVNETSAATRKIIKSLLQKNSATMTSLIKKN